MQQPVSAEGGLDPRPAAAQEPSGQSAPARPRLLPALPAVAWLALAGDLAYWLGIGLAVPFLLTYLHIVRGLELSVAGLVVASGFGAGFVSAPIAGILSDRCGPRPVLLGGLALGAAGSLLLLAAQAPWHAFAASMLILGCGQSVVTPTMAALLASLAGAERQTEVLTVRYTGVNVGFGAGAAIASVVVETGDPSTFQRVFLAQALMCAAAIVTLYLVPRRALAPRAPASPGGAPRSERRAVLPHLLRDGAFWTLWAIGFLFYTAGTAQLASGFTLYATLPGHVGARALGLALATNSAVIVALQFVVLRWMRGRRRTRALMLLFLLWLAAWGCVGASGQLGAGAAAGLAFVLAAGLLGLGETLMAPNLFPLAIQLAPEGMQGRYSALLSLAASGGFVVAPALSGFLLGAGDGRLFLLVMLAGCAAGLGLARLLERRLPAQANRVRG
jgi:MFS family permease